MWYFVYKSGVHATVAGVLTALCIPIKTSKRKEMLLDWEHTLAPIVYFVIMPIFAFANAGLSFTGLSINSLLHPVALGIALGLFVGKQVGVLLFSYVAKVSKIAKLPEGASILQVYGTGVLTGIGFTMSLFIGNLAFVSEDGLINYIRLGVFVGSLASALLGLAVLRLSSTGGVANVVGVNATTLSK
jgi:NhaA family Na+:H+ antiporter